MANVRFSTSDEKGTVMVSSSENWKSFFEDWPGGFPRQGIIVSNLNEAMPFKNFWLKGNVLLLERTVPDALGGRFLLLGFDIVNSVKITNPLTADIVAGAGFREPKAPALQSSY